MKSTEEQQEVYAWVSDPKRAKAVTEEQIEEFRLILGDSLAVERRTDGSLALYTSEPGTKARLDALMAVVGLFQEQRIYVRCDRQSNT